MPSTTAETLSLVQRSVSVAPLVLLSVVDHYNRGATNKTKNKRVVGVLLGQNDGKSVRVSNSFAGAFLLNSSPPPEACPTADTSPVQCRSKRTRKTLRSGF